MASVASKLIEEVTAHAQSDSLEDAREICADGSYFPNNLSKRRINFREQKIQTAGPVLPIYLHLELITVSPVLSNIHHFNKYSHQYV